MTGRTSILVDARFLHSSGIGRYLRGILSRILRDDRFSRVRLLGDPAELREHLAREQTRATVSVAGYPTSAYSPRFQLRWLLSRLGRGHEADVSFFPHYDAPFLLLPERSVVTVHDLIHFKVPDAFPAWQRTLGGALLDRVVSQAARVIAVSASTRGDLAERAPESASKIQVVHNGVNPYFRPLAPAEQVEGPEGESLRPFLLCVGNRKPHKNLTAAVEALALLRERWPELRLVVAGGKAGADWSAVVRRATQLGVADAVVELPHVDDDRLLALYNTCEALVFPSLYEGFGFPAVEAMACGAPVVASDRASLPEVVGDAGLLVDPTDPRQIAEAVRRIREEPGLRERLVGRGRERAGELSEEASVERTVEVLLEVGRG